MLIVCSIFLIRLPIKTWMQDLGVTGPIEHVFWVAMMALAAILPIPSEPVMTASIEASGMFFGTVDNLIGTLCGAILLFFVGRLISPTVHALVQRAHLSRMQSLIDTLLAKNQFFLVLIIQLLPFPFLLANLLLGSIREIRFRSFLLGSAIGFLPYQLIWDGVMAGFVHGGLTGTLVSVSAVFVVLFVAYISGRLRSKQAKAKQNS